MAKTLMLALVAVACAACNPGTDSQTGTAGNAVVREQAPMLTQGYARLRAGQVTDVRYDLDVVLAPEPDYYTGENQISFDWQGGATDLTIDFTGGTINEVRVNGSEADAAYNDWFLTVPASALRQGRNEVLVRFTHAWSDTGVGLYRFDDPVDGRTYLYSDFEPYDASFAFPLFDQPDIKARFKLTVDAPADWQVISASRETSVEALGDGVERWFFPATLPIPTYIMSLHAGDYVAWEDAEFRIPLRLFARQSMAEYAEQDTAMWFGYTRAGFDFFEEYYGVDYPFGKYDQLIVPDFNSGAMENVGAVTFNERSYIQRDGWSYKERKNLAEVILHEMAHMWFGNIVTMRWWNGLWLNETFAEFMGYQPSAQLGFEDAWQGFYLDRKYLAYWQDQRRTTHPVDTPVPDTDSVGANFDMISYAKGASVLRQIEYRLGPETFRRGINIYLERHAFGNAELDDLVAALAEAADMNLDQWAYEWLHTAGANTIEARFSCADGEVTEFALQQTATDEHPILRTQKVQVGLFRDVGGTVNTDTVVPVLYSGETTDVPGAVGAPCPDIVYPNYGDRGYVLVKLDAKTRMNLAPMIGHIADPFQRVMFWQTFWDNVRFAQIPVTDYLDAVFASAAKEDDINNVDQVYAFVGSAVNYLRSMGAPGAAALAEYRPRAETVTWANVERTRGDLQTMYLDRYLAFASSEAAQQQFIALLDGDTTVPGRELDQDRRWTMLQILSAEGHPRTDELVALEAERDPSDDGRRAQLRILASRPDIDVKREIIADVANRSSENSYADQRTMLGVLFPAGQEHLREMLADEILAQIRANKLDPDPAYAARARAFAAYLIPASCTSASVARLGAAVAEHADNSASIRDYFLDKHEDDALCVARADLLSAAGG